ncbi:MAG: dihydrodipicolinate synthase family protein [Bacteroidia bacterium]|nr:dihydrodipicolinate synthase family protein [Bacteroidia bacterium]
MPFESNLPQGVIAATLTPMNEDLSVNYPMLLDHINWLLENGCNGICILGTTGEANSFSLSERIELIDKVIDSGIDPSKFLVGTGCCAYTDTIALTKHAVSKGAGGVLMLPPFYYKNLTDEGVMNYFDLVIRGVDDDRLRIYLYHFPKMTSVPFTLELTRKLVQAFPGTVVGMKDSGGDWDHMQSICGAFPGFKFYAGTEKFLLPTLKIGGVGCISASANATASMCAAVYENWESEQADDFQQLLTEARLSFEGAAFVSGLKYFFSEIKNDRRWLNVRPPNVVLSSDLHEKFRVNIDQFKLRHQV